MRFTDPRSKAQVAAFRLHELHAARWRNAKNLQRWNDGCRDRWEAENLRLVESQPDTWVQPLDYDELPV